MFGSGSSSSSPAPKPDPDNAGGKADEKSPSPPDGGPGGTDGSSGSNPAPIKTSDQAASGEKRSGNGSPPSRAENGPSTDKKRRSSGVGSKASSLLASARNTLNFAHVGRSNSDLSAQTPIQKLGKQDPALAVPQGQYNNSAGESRPGPRSTFRVGVWEDRNRKCRRTMEDTHAFLYNFLSTPAPVTDVASSGRGAKASDADETSDDAADADADVVESDNGYFAIFDGHAGTFAADWCGKKLHVILEETVRRNPNAPMPELLDQTFTTVDSQLERLPVKNSGCTAAIAVLRWEDRVPSERSATGSQPIAAAAAESATAGGEEKSSAKEESSSSVATPPESVHVRLKPAATRQRVLYTANVGDARIVLCRSGKALRLSYDHKGSDENEGRRIANAGGLILNNRVNGVLAVTRALGDAYMKDLVTGHPYTTETVIQPDSDEFVIIACDGIWDVCGDQEAVDLIRNIQDPVTASKLLVDHALSRFSTDNLSCMVVRLEKEAVSKSQEKGDVGVEAQNGSARVSEVDKIVGETKRKMASDSSAAVGVSPSNSGRGHEPIAPDEGDESSPTVMDGPVLEEEPGPISEGEGSETTSAKDKATEPKKPDGGK